MKKVIMVMVVLLTTSCGSSDYSNFMDVCDERKDFFTRKSCMSPARLEKLCECLGNAIYNHEMNGQKLPQEYQMSVETKQRLISGEFFKEDKSPMPAHVVQAQAKDGMLLLNISNACLLQNMPKTKAEQEDEAKYCKK